MLSSTRIARPDKDRMRAQLEEILRQQKSLLEKIEAFSSETKVGEYSTFWGELKTSYHTLNQKISRYMVRKCNR